MPAHRFMQSDPWWSFAMAVNVYLVFFHNADPALFRKYLWVYCLVCFGGPMLPAVILISIRGDPRGPVYGDAAVSRASFPHMCLRPSSDASQLWCWIGPNWSLLRLYAYYIPIWLCILLSIVAYVAVGYRVFHSRNQLLNIGVAEHDDQKPSRSGSDGDSADEARQASALSLLAFLQADADQQKLVGRPDVYGTVVTEVQVTCGALGPNDLPLASPGTYTHAASTSLGPNPSWTMLLPQDAPPSRDGQQPQQFETLCTAENRNPPRLTLGDRLRAAMQSASLKLKRLDPVKMAYLRTSFIFAFAVLITWIPSSINRLYSLTNDGKISFPLSVASGCVLPLQGVWNNIIFLTTS